MAEGAFQRTNAPSGAVMILLAAIVLIGCLAGILWAHFEGICSGYEMRGWKIDRDEPWDLTNGRWRR